MLVFLFYLILSRLISKQIYLKNKILEYVINDSSSSVDIAIPIQLFTDLISKFKKYDCKIIPFDFKAFKDMDRENICKDSCNCEEK